jgi:hypothetical protein
MALMAIRADGDERETYADFAPKDTWTQVLPRLWIGATDDDDTLGHELEEPRITLANFDTVISLHAWSNPADWHVREIRQPFHDGDLSEIDVQDLWFVANAVFDDWMNGKRVLVRCLAGLNRSGLIIALVMIMAGYSASDAIGHLRTVRSRNALCNQDFAQWLLGLDVTGWRREL